MQQLFYHKISMVEFSKPSNDKSKIKKKEVRVKVTRIETNDINPQMCKLLPYESEFFIHKTQVKSNNSSIRKKKVEETNKPNINSQLPNCSFPSSQSPLTTQTPSSSPSPSSPPTTTQQNPKPNKRPIIRTSISIRELLN